jgi:hypothetical protein
MVSPTYEDGPVTQTAEYPAGQHHAGTQDPGAHDPGAHDPGTYPGHLHPAFVAPPPGRFAGFMLRMWARSPRWLAPLAILACFGGAVGYVLLDRPIDGAGDTTTCLAKLTTGFDCPGCGGTRAFYYLLQGNLPAAARHHLVFVFAVPFLAYMYLAWAGNQVFRWRLPQLRPGPLVVGMVVTSLGVFAVLRNLPWEPFTWFYV